MQKDQSLAVNHLNSVLIINVLILIFRTLNIVCYLIIFLVLAS